MTRTTRRRVETVSVIFMTCKRNCADIQVRLQYISLPKRENDGSPVRSRLGGPDTPP